MPYSTNAQANRKLYAALMTAITQLTCFGNSPLLQQIVDDIKRSNDNTFNLIDHNIFSTALLHLLRKYPDTIRDIIYDDNNQPLLEHLRRIKGLNQNDLDTIIEIFNDIQKKQSLQQPSSKSGI